MTGNPEQRAFWNEQAGPRWVSADEHVASMLAPCSEVLFARAAIGTGERVLDVGCGAGQTTVELAARTGPDGRVVGLDVSAPLLARARARGEGLPHVAFVEADAQVHEFGDARFDAVVSRFGVMFFADPTAAFTRLRDACDRGGRLAFVCWRGLPDNPWFVAPLRAMARHVEPPLPPEPGAPGPFGLSDDARIAEVLARAGWTRVVIEPIDLSLVVGRDPDDALRVAQLIGATAAPLAQAEPDARQAALAAMREVYVGAQDRGAVRMAGAIWAVTASAG
ncbi:MAG: methyltransferase domain-containing protein [Nannocystaceae bacterium]|nr:methyltransferase domain-containing protein [Nannocystaceae bacterium]